jgi:microcystin-dependent protein
MAEITTTQSFSDGDTVTATKLNNIQANASIQPDAILNRTAETSLDQANDLALVYDSSASSLKKVTISNLIKAGTASDFPITGNATIGGTLGVTGTSALTGNTTIGGTLGVTGASTLSGNASIGGTLGVTGASTLSGNTSVLGALGVSDTVSLTKSTGTGLAVTSNATIGGTLGVSGASTLTGNASVGGTLGVTGLITATGGVAGAITGNVTGSITGNVTGNVIGNVTGNVSGSSGSCTGNASTATALATGRTIAMTGDVSYTSASFDGTGNVSGTSTLASSGVTAGTYGSSSSIPQITVDSKGRITSVSGVSPIVADLSPSPSGTYGASESTPVITVNAKGQITSASTVATQIPALGSSPAGTYGSSTVVPAITVNTRGQVTAVTNTSISFPSVTTFIAGMMTQYAGSTAPSKWLLCDGSAVSRTTYSDLYTAIGTTYGVGNGSTTFNIPDLRGRTPIGVGTGSGLTARARGDTGGAETVTLTDEIGTHGSHSHTIYATNGASSGSYYTRGDIRTASSTNNFTTASSTVSGSGASHANMQPFIAINFIIYSGV